jgi:hypothetical protein
LGKERNKDIPLLSEGVVIVAFPSLGPRNGSKKLGIKAEKYQPE